jgi:hypothetical protein
MRKFAGVVGGMLLLVAGCSSPQGSDAEPATPTATSTSTSESSTTVAPPSSTGLPAAADGADVTACGDGTCEVQVSAAGPIPLPGSAGATLTIESIGDGSVDLAFTPTGVDFSSGCEPVDACTNQLRGGIPGSLVRARTGATVTFNQVSVVVAAVAGTTGLLHITPAP